MTICWNQINVLKLIIILDSWHPSNIFVGISFTIHITYIHLKRWEERKSVLCDTWNHLKYTSNVCMRIGIILLKNHTLLWKWRGRIKACAYFTVFACIHGIDLAYHFVSALHLNANNSILHNKFLTSFHIYWHYWDVMWFSREVPIYR